MIIFLIDLKIVVSRAEGGKCQVYGSCLTRLPSGHTWISAPPRPSLGFFVYKCLSQPYAGTLQTAVLGTVRLSESVISTLKFEHNSRAGDSEIVSIYMEPFSARFITTDFSLTPF